VRLDDGNSIAAIVNINECDDASNATLNLTAASNAPHWHAATDHVTLWRHRILWCCGRPAHNPLTSQQSRDGKVRAASEVN